MTWVIFVSGTMMAPVQKIQSMLNQACGFTEITSICSSYTSSATTLFVVHSSRLRSNLVHWSSRVYIGGFGDRREWDDQNATSVEPLLSLGLLLWFPNLI